MKKSVIFGTAGHIDHGKSSLVFALTGKDPDRLKEEKEKGITIELGFAGMETDEAKISFVDVPGHEGLIKTMIAGSVGFDAVLFCVDGREGIKPQTIEHYNIVRTIGVRSCVLAVTKADLCTKEQISETENAVRELFSGSGISITAAVATSISDPASLAELKNAISNCARKVMPKIQKRCYLVRADRVFSIKGSGTVVTGTSIFGQVTTGAQIYNTRNTLTAKVKSIQVHDKPVEKSVAGERTALNLPDFPVQSVERGDILTDNRNIKSVSGVYATVNVFDGISENISIKHNKTYPVYIGALVCEGKIIFYDNKALTAGQSAVCLIKFDKPVVTYFDEPFIIRAGSPRNSIAGGRVLALEDTLPDRKSAKEIIELLEEHNFDSAIRKMVELYHCGLRLPEPIQFSGLMRGELSMKLAQLNIANFNGFILDNARLENYVENTIDSLNKKGSLAISMIQHTCEELPEPVRFDIINRIIERAQKENYIFDGQMLKKKQKDPFEELSMSILNSMKADPALSNHAVLAEKTGTPPAKIQKCLQYLCNRSLAKNIGGNNHVTMELLNSFVEKAVLECQNSGYVDLQGMKKHFSLPRKLLVPLLEQLDRTGLFVNKDNKRILKK